MSYLNAILDFLFWPISKILENHSQELRFFPHTSKNNEADVVVGFGIGLTNNGELSNLSKGVVRVCAALRKHTKFIVFTGGNSENSITEAIAMKNFILNGWEISPDQIITESSARNTRENARFTINLLKIKQINKPGLRVVCVGSHFHVVRCYKAFKKLAPKDWKISLLGAHSEFDFSATQKRLRAMWRFMIWESIARTWFKLKGWT